MASRGSFQKRQKEAARKEKRQMKLDRRQGRAPVAPTLNGHSSDQSESQEDSLDNLLEDNSTPSASHVGPEGHSPDSE